MPESVNVARVTDIRPGEMKAVEMDEEQVCLVNLDGTLYAINNICTHAEGPYPLALGPAAETA